MDVQDKHDWLCYTVKGSIDFGSGVKNVVRASRLHNLFPAHAVFVIMSRFLQNYSL